MLRAIIILVGPFAFLGGTDLSALLGECRDVIPDYFYRLWCFLLDLFSPFLKLGFAIIRGAAPTRVG